MECRCNHVDVLWGDDAEAYAAEHLVADPSGELVCPDTGARWRVVEHANEQAELRRISP